MFYELSKNHVVACIPYYRCQKYIRRAVDSLLAQTHQALTVVVVNDADFDTPPWPELADIDDPRLIRFDLLSNRGLYFANAIVSRATKAPFFLVQDADDWSHPERVERLLKIIQEENSDIAVCKEVQFQEDILGGIKVMETRYQYRAPFAKKANNEHLEYFTTQLDNSYYFRLGHHALFRSGILNTVGGYYAGLRQHFDTLLINLLLMVGRVSHIKEPLYWRLHWPGALTKHPDTRFGTEVSRNAMKQGERLYMQAYSQYRDFLAGRIKSQDFCESLRAICNSNISLGNQLAYAEEEKRFRDILLR